MFAPAAGADSPKGDPSATLEGKGLIQPYGGLSWEDGHEGVVHKLNGIGGVEKIVLGNGIYEHSENVKGRIGKELRDSLVKSYGRFTDEGNFANPELSRAKFFIDGRGEKVPFHECQPAEITVSPVVLGGVPFEMRLEYVYSPGLVVLYPGRVILANDGRQDYAIAMVLRRVSMSTSSPLLADRLNDIKTMIVGAYGRFKGGLSHDGDSVWGKVGDAAGTIMTVDIGKTTGFISWSSGAFGARLDEAIRKRGAE
jgi:hypothetical protein